MLKVKKTQIEVVVVNDIIDDVSEVLGLGYGELRDKVTQRFDFSWGDTEAVLVGFYNVRDVLDAVLDDLELDLTEEQTDQLNHQLNQYFDDIERTGLSILVE
jgi:hypothetical protein